MMKVTTHHAKTHLSRLLKQVAAGETIIITSGNTPVAKLTAIQETTHSRPEVGEKTSAPIRWSSDAFDPLGDRELTDWGL